ncbi:MAG: hypothetical protein ACREF1_03305 [Acetobacteraceae bacterium]
MTISAASIAHALHAVTHRSQHPSATRGESFAQQLKAAQTGGDGSLGKPADLTGELLSSDMLQAVQTIR